MVCVQNQAPAPGSALGTSLVRVHHSAQLSQFLADNNITRRKSSAGYAQSNGAAEKAVAAKEALPVRRRWLVAPVSSRCRPQSPWRCLLKAGPAVWPSCRGCTRMGGAVCRGCTMMGGAVCRGCTKMGGAACARRRWDGLARQGSPPTGNQ